MQLQKRAPKLIVHAVPPDRRCFLQDPEFLVRSTACSALQKLPPEASGVTIEALTITDIIYYSLGFPIILILQRSPDPTVYSNY